jgi:hypothetical protein
MARYLCACPQLAPSMFAPISFAKAATICSRRKSHLSPASVKLLVDREIAGIERAMFAVENQIIELDLAD